MASPWNLQRTSYREVKDISYEVAVLPIGATEPHGMHLPYGVDAFHSQIISEHICERAWDKGAKVVLLPTVPYGVDTNQMAFPLAMNVDQSTLNGFVMDLVDSLSHHGIRKLMILNGHGGNEFKGFLREIYGKTDVFVTVANWWQVGSDRMEEFFEEPGDHADELETSIGLALFPELVHMEHASKGTIYSTEIEALNNGWVQMTRPWHLATDDSTLGDPRKSTIEKGLGYLDIVEERLVNYLVDLARVPMSEHFPYAERTE